MTVKLAIVPSPESGTGSQRRAPHSGHSSFGGTASAPQPPQRIAVNLPSRAAAKKRPRVTVDSVTAEETDEHGRGVAAERVREAAPRTLDLASAGLAAQLRDDLADLRGPRRPDRVSLGLQPARGIHGNLAAETRPSFLRGDPAGARLEQAEAFGGDDLGDREAVVQLDDVDILRSDARLTVRRRRRTLGGGHAREIALVAEQHPVGGGRRGEDPDRPAGRACDVFRCQHQRGPAVAERTAIVELERIGDLRRAQHGLERDLLAELRLRIQDPVAVILHGHCRHLLLGGAVLVHVGAGHDREDAGERHAEHRGGLRPGVQLFLRFPADDVAVVERLHAAGRHLRVGQRVGRRLGEQLGRRALVPTELRDTDSDHRHSTHARLRTNRLLACNDNRQLEYGAMALVVLGCGWIARRHARAARRLWLPVIFASRDVARARAYAREFGGVGAYGDYDNALRDPRARAAVVCTPHDRHLDDVLQALAAGRHVLVEKPLARTLDEADRMIDAAARAGRVLMTAENFRFMPAFRWVRCALDARLLGEPRELHLIARGWRRHAGWRLTSDAGGGALIDGGIHYVHALRWWGGEVRRVFALRPPQTLGDMAGEDAVDVLAECDGGAIGVLANSLAAPGVSRFQWSSVTRARATRVLYNRGRWVLIRGRDGVRARLFWRDTRGHEAMLRAFGEAMTSGRVSEMDGAEGRRDLAVVLAAYRSLAEGAPVNPAC